MEWCDDNYTAFDFETSGKRPEYALQPWRIPSGDAWATSLVWVTRKQGVKKPAIFGGLNPTKAVMREMLVQALDEKRTLLGWNTVFDIAILIAYGLEDLVMKARWLDGMLIWRHLDVEPEYEVASHQKKSFGLKAAVAEFLPQHAGYEAEIDFHDPSPKAREALHFYNIQDNLFTWRITKHLWGHLTSEQQRCALIEAQSLPLIASANVRGMPVDTLAARELSAHLSNVAAEQLVKLAPHGVTEKVVRSPLQLSKLLFDQWGLPVLKENKSKTKRDANGQLAVSRSTDKEVLHELSFMDDRAKELKLYREALNNKAKFAEGLLASVAYNGDGRTYPLAIVFGTYSGRLTYSSNQRVRGVNPKNGRERWETRQTGFPLHQMKKGLKFRSTSVSPPGYTLMEFDASGQEFRWMAIASGDPVMLNLCAPGEDPHAYMGSRISHQDYDLLRQLLKAGDNPSKEIRQLGKIGNLSLQYRTSAKKLRTVARVQYGMDMQLSEAQHIHAVYPQSYQRVPEYWKQQIYDTKLKGYVETFAGRRVSVVGNWDGPFGWSMGSTSINYRIQGTGADQKYLALAVLKSYLVEIGAYFAWDLHDGIYLYVPNAMVERAAVEIKRRLDNLPYQRAWGFTPPIELPWDCKVGASWGHLKEFKV